MNPQEYKSVPDMIVELIIINNDRRKTYEKAVLMAVFNGLADQSATFSEELQQFVPREMHIGSEDTSANGRLFRTWMDIKAMFTLHDPKTVLNTCAHAEVRLLDVYQYVLDSEMVTDKELRNALLNQYEEVEKTHEDILDAIELQSN
jgi:uncharacterized protein (TIGR02284 family)